MISPLFKLSGSDARGLLYGLLEVDKLQLREDPSLPSMRGLIQSGKVKYRQADPDEHWQSYKEIVDQVKSTGFGFADCEDLATAVSAEDQVRHGVGSLPFAYPPRPGLFHVVTAVPQEQFGSIPQSSWPGARSAPPVPGYVLQDPSAAAGMGSDFNGTEEASVGYGNDGSSRSRRRVKPAREGQRQGGGVLGRAVKSIGQSLGLGRTVSELGSGLREGAGVQKGWAADLGRNLGSSLSPLGGLAGSEEDVVESLREGADAESDAQFDGEMDSDVGLDAGFDDDEEMFGLFDDDDEDDVFGLELEDRVGSSAWHLDQLANRVSDDLFGSDDFDEDDEDDEDFGALDNGGPPRIGLFREHLRGFQDGMHEDLEVRYGEDRFDPPEHMRPLPHHLPHRGPLGAPMASFDAEARFPHRLPGSPVAGTASGGGSRVQDAGSVFGAMSLFGSLDLDEDDEFDFDDLGEEF